MKNSAAYWQGQASNHTLQRVYGVTFPDKKELAQVLKNLSSGGVIPNLQNAENLIYRNL